jgi:acetoacetate decarboxylase
MKTGVRYRMPVVFGPSVSPRQHPDGRPWKIEETGTMTLETASIRYRTDAEKLKALLPPGFELRGEPVITLNYSWFKDLYWLAGRGYGVVMPTFPVTYYGKDEILEGNFNPCIWEGNSDAIMTGREEMGFAKLFADIPETVWNEKEGTLSGEASWYGHKFFELNLSGMKEIGGKPNQSIIGNPNIWFKYIPKTAVNGTGGGEVAYATTNAPAANPAAAFSRPNLEISNYRRWTAGKADIKWHRATFEQLPLTAHIVNKIADLEILEVIDAEVSSFSMPGIGISADELRAIEPKDENRVSILHPSISE